MKYVLDFDRTLFDVERLYDALERMNIRHLAGTTESLDRLDVPGLLFNDVKVFLEKKKKNDMFILSSSSGISGEWEDEYQKNKITASGVNDLVENVFVMSGMKGDSLKKVAKQFPVGEPIVFVDDRIEQCLSVRQTLPDVRCFLMVRTPDAIGDVAAVQGIPVVHTLQEVDDIIESI